MPFDFGELFTQSARRVVPLLFEKKLACSFDCRGPRVMVSGDANAVRRSLHRLMCALVDVLDVGLAVLHAGTRMTRLGRCTMTVRLAGAGMVANDDCIDRVLQRLELSEEIDEESPRLRRARGQCPSTGAPVRFASLRSEGVLFTIEWTFHIEMTAEMMRPSDARSARAWVIGEDNVVCESLVHRLQRLGWATSKFEGAPTARRHLRTMPKGNALPALVIGVECASVLPRDLHILRRFLPSWTMVVYAVLPGSPTLCNSEAAAGFDVRALPLSPLELQAMTNALSPEADEPSGLTIPAPLTMADRPLAVIAADNEWLRLSASTLLEALGYEPKEALGDLEALQQCRRLDPAVVLLDMQSPGLDSLSVTRQLRLLERSGEVAPSVILAVSRDSTDETVRACRACGMDGHVEKPLALSGLRSELQRVCAVVDQGS